MGENIAMMGLAGWVVGAIGLFVAIYQIRERQKSRAFMRSEAWAKYARTHDVATKTQRNLSIYREYHADQIYPDVLETLTRSDAQVTELLHDAIRNVKYAEPQFSAAAIEYWHATGKISDSQITHFYPLVVGGEPNGNRRTAPVENREPLAKDPED
ncbi:MAG: hypothetical protein AAF420_06275 [Pseudomonadota bacterium]